MKVLTIINKVLLEELSLRRISINKRNEKYGIYHNGEYLSIDIELKLSDNIIILSKFKREETEDIEGIKEIKEFVINNKVLRYGFNKKEFIEYLKKIRNYRDAEDYINKHIVDENTVELLLFYYDNNNWVGIEKVINDSLLPVNESKYLISPSIELIRRELQNGNLIYFHPVNEKLEQFYLLILNKYGFKYLVNSNNYLIIGGKN